MNRSSKKEHFGKVTFFLFEICGLKISWKKNRTEIAQESPTKTKQATSWGKSSKKNVSCEAKLPHSAPCLMGWDGVSSVAADVTGPVGRFTVMARASNLPRAAQPQPTNNPSSLTRRRKEQHPHYLPSLNTPKKTIYAARYQFLFLISE